jgi:hypothetical protein
MILALALLLQDADPPLGEKKVQTKEAWFYKGPSRGTGPLRKAEDGEEVTVSAVEGLNGRWSKSQAKKDNLQGYILSSALIAKERHKVSAADQKEGEKLAAQGLEGQRGLNEPTEREYRSSGGPAREKSFQELEALMTRPAGRLDRAALEQSLKEFRDGGKLGEYSPVK